MAAPDNWLYEYAVVRFVPRVHREEFINIGLIMMNKRHRWLKGKILIDENKVKALCPHSDMDMLKNQCRIFESSDVPAPELPVEEKYRWLAAVKSAVIQVGPSHPGIIARHIIAQEAPDFDFQSLLDNEFNRLFAELVL